MALKRAGFFRELRHGDPSGPSLLDCRSTVAAGDRQRIASYLRSGTVLAATGNRVGDWFEPNRQPDLELAVLTDGKWVWPSDLAYYVEAHGVCVPDEFAQHMSERGWEAPAIAQEDLLAIEAQFLGEP